MQHKFTKPQLEKMLSLMKASEQNTPNRTVNETKVFVSSVTTDAYVKIVSDKLDPQSNGVAVDIEYICIHPDGSTSDCLRFENPKEQIKFLTEMTEIFPSQIEKMYIS